MSMSDSIDEEYRAATILIYFTVGSVALLLYDCALTFVSEIQRVWRRRFSGAMVVYLFVRYTLLFSRIFLVLELQPWGEDAGKTVCKLLERTFDVLSILSSFGCALLLILRIYAVWGRDWRPLVFLAPLSLADPVIRLLQAVSVRVSHGRVYDLLVCSETPTSWVAIIQTPLQLVAITTSIAANLLFVGLTWYKTFKIRRDLTTLTARQRIPIASFLFRDGSIYFVLSLCNTFINFLYAVGESSFLTTQAHVALCIGFWLAFSPTFTVIILSRFILALRGLYFADSEESPVSLTRTATAPSVSSSFGHSAIRLSASKLIGNLGATVDIGYADTKTAETDLDEDEDEEVPQFSSDPFMAGMRRSACAAGVSEGSELGISGVVN